MIGQLESEASARLFSDFLYAQGIDNQTEPERGGGWALWIHAEEQMEAAKTLLNEYRQNSRDPKYQQASRVAEEKWRQEQKANEAAEKRFHDRSKLFPFGGLGVGYLTAVLIGISVATALVSSFGDNKKPILWLFISERIVEGGLSERLAGLLEIRHGEVWRLFTPMLVHFSLPHLFFNWLWMLDLGTMIERRQSARMLLALVLAPVLCLLFFRNLPLATDNILVGYLKRSYLRTLERVLDHRLISLGIFAALILVTACYAVPRLGREFMPELEEGNLWIRGTFPVNVSLEEVSEKVRTAREIMQKYGVRLT